MQKITLYKTTRESGGVTVSPLKPADGITYTEAVRLIADEGKALTKDGVNFTNCVDTETAEGWAEVDAADEEGNPHEPLPEEMIYSRYGVYAPETDFEHRIVVVEETEEIKNQIF